jgi:hypothetical protein
MSSNEGVHYSGCMKFYKNNSTFWSVSTDISRCHFCNEKGHISAPNRWTMIMISILKWICTGLINIIGHNFILPNQFTCPHPPPPKKKLQVIQFMCINSIFAKFSTMLYRWKYLLFLAHCVVLSASSPPHRCSINSKHRIKENAEKKLVM